MLWAHLCDLLESNQPLCLKRARRNRFAKITLCAVCEIRTRSLSLEDSHATINTYSAFSGGEDNRNLLSVLARHWRHLGTCAPIAEYVGFEPLLHRDRVILLPLYYVLHLRPYKESNPDKGLRRPLCFPLHHKDVCGNGRTRTYCLRLNRP